VKTSVRIAKRALDVFASSVGLALTIPLYPIIAAVIYAESPGPVLFRQRRAGRLLSPDPGSRNRFRFEEFEMIKFRTMCLDAEAATGAVIAEENDRRVTRVGQFLRHTRLDEIPQFWNVLRGEMSLVGPRPERPEIIVDLALAIPFFEERMRGVKPGLTGLAQVSLGYTGSPLPGSDIESFTRALTNLSRSTVPRAQWRTICASKRCSISPTARPSRISSHFYARKSRSCCVPPWP